MQQANPLRGEAQFSIGGISIVLALTNDALARLDAEFGGLSLQGMFDRLIGMGYGTLKTALPILAIRATKDGDEINALKAVAEVWPLLDAHAIATIVGPALVSLTAPFLGVDAEKNGEAPETTNAKAERSASKH